MTGRESFKSAPANNSGNGSRDSLDAEYRRFLEKVVKEHPELKDLGRDDR